MMKISAHTAKIAIGFTLGGIVLGIGFSNCSKAGFNQENYDPTARAPSNEQALQEFYMPTPVPQTPQGTIADETQPTTPPPTYKPPVEAPPVTKNTTTTTIRTVTTTTVAAVTPTTVKAPPTASACVSDVGTTCDKINPDQPRYLPGCRDNYICTSYWGVWYHNLTAEGCEARADMECSRDHNQYYPNDTQQKNCGFKYPVAPTRHWRRNPPPPYDLENPKLMSVVFDESSHVSHYGLSCTYMGGPTDVFRAVADGACHAVRPFPQYTIPRTFTKVVPAEGCVEKPNPNWTSKGTVACDGSCK